MTKATRRLLYQCHYTDYNIYIFELDQRPKNTKSPDILMDGEKWELKAPKTDKLSAIERNLKRATKQSGNVVIDTHRLRKIHDGTVQAFLLQKFKQQKTIKKLLLVNRKHQVIDISKLI